MTERPAEQHGDEDALRGALPGAGGDSEYGNDTGFAGDALGSDPAGTPDDQPTSAPEP